MKIVLMVSSMNAGGAERVAATLSNAWVAQGHQVVLMPTYPVKGKSFYPLSPSVQLAWLADRLGSRAKSIFSPLWKLREMRRFIIESQPDVVVSFLTNVNVMTLLASWRLNVPVVVCERTNPAVSTSSGRVLSFMRRLLYPRASAVSVQTQATAQSFATMVAGMPRLDVLPNPLPPDLEAMAPATLQPDSQGRFRIVAMGRLQANKRFDRLVDMFARLQADFPDWDLHIFGEGPMRHQLEAQVRELGLGRRVYLPGRTPSAWSELQRGSVFAMTSAVEGFPNALLEAMALGLPAVVFDCPSGPREMTNNGQYGILVPPGDEAAFITGLRALLGDASKRAAMGADAAAAMRQRYSVSQVLAQWDRVFSKVVMRHD